MFGFERGVPFPVHHYYLRGLDDIVLKEGGVVKRTLANSTGRNTVALGGVAAAQTLAAFPSRHARVAFLLRVHDYLPDQKDSYVLSTDQVMLDRLHDQVSVDFGLAKAELKRSINNIHRVFCQHSVCNQIKIVERILAANPGKKLSKKDCCFN